MSRAGVYLGRSTTGHEYLRLDKANRHGLVAGVTGAGKTTTLQTLAKGFSDQGVPCFAADVKGDLAGIAIADQEGARAPPVKLWDVYGDQGHRIKTPLDSLGPILLARLLELNDPQTGVLNIAFHIAKEHGARVGSTADLASILQFMTAYKDRFAIKYGHISPASVAVIQRKLLALESEGAKLFLGFPEFDIHDFIQRRKSSDGRRSYGIVNILAADRLYLSPKLYSTFMFWFLSQMFEKLPEVGDTLKPKLVVFIDEAHLLFKDATKPVLEQLDRVVRLVRSKGVGLYFITQSPTDIPNDILRQLNNRVQHALRAYTPQDQKLVKAAAQSYRPNDEFDTAYMMQNLEIGDALVSCLDEQGMPRPVELTRIKCPATRLGPLTKEERNGLTH